LANLKNIEFLNIQHNVIDDVSALSNLTNLKTLWFNGNEVKDISSLVENDGLGEGDEINMMNNYLDLSESSKDMNNINTLIDRGVEVEYVPQN